MKKVNESITSWNSHLVKKIEEDYKRKRNSFERLEFLISLLLVYNMNHSHGEYDIFTIIDENTELERGELKDFLDKGFRQLQSDFGFSE